MKMLARNQRSRRHRANSILVGMRLGLGASVAFGGL